MVEDETRPKIRSRYKRVMFSNPHQTAEIGPGEHSTVYKKKIPHDSVAFINKVGNNIPIDGKVTYYIWQIGTERVGKKPIRRVIGEINDPYEYEPPILVEGGKTIEWIGVNDDDEAHTFEVVCDGILYKREK